ncbi:MAG: BF3164 family lipoprotein [Bacteroidota bacterium]
MVKKLILILISTSSFLVFAQTKFLKLEEKFTLGEEDYYFTYPERVITDKNDKIYIIDRNATEIIVFKSNGEFDRKIGRSGKGPGEYVEITNFFFQENLLTVFDRSMQRFIQYSNDKKFSTFSTPTKKVMNPLLIEEFNDKTIFIYDPTNVEATDKIFHLVSSDFTNILYSFGDPSLIFDYSTQFARSLKGIESLDLCIISKNKIFITPKFYNGEIIIAERQKNDWTYKRIKGSKPNVRAYVEHPLADLNSLRKENIPFVILSGRNNKFLVSVNCVSSGIFKYDDKYIFHFFSVFDKKKDTNIYLNIFDYDGNLINTEKIFNRKTLYDFDVMAKGSGGFFIIRDIVNEIPVLKKVIIYLTGY